MNIFKQENNHSISISTWLEDVRNHYDRQWVQIYEEREWDVRQNQVTTTLDIFWEFRERRLTWRL